MYRSVRRPSRSRSLARLVRAAVIFVSLLGSQARAGTVVSGVEGAMLDNVLAYLDVDDLDCSVSAAAVNGSPSRTAALNPI